MAERGLRAEVIAVGSELLLGEAVDTNSAWLSARLAEQGVDVYRHATVGDNIERIVAELDGATRRADVVLVCGGLGPTQDDVTRVALARLTGVRLERRPELVEYLRSYFAQAGRTMPERNLVQADVPAGARVLDPVGTAPGLVVARDDATVYCMPGVPAEMEAMVERSVLPELARRSGATTVSRVVRTAGLSESGVAERCAALVDRLDAAGNPTIAFLASRGETRVRVTAKAATRAAALTLADPVVEELVGLLGSGMVGVDDEGVEHAVARLLRRAGWTLAVAESISGGGLGARLVTVPGASDWFGGGMVTYGTAAKATLAGVPPELLGEHGPVSEPVAGALAAGVRQRLGAAVGLAVVGVAGPTTQGGRPVGTVCVACALPAGRSASRTVQLPSRSRPQLQEWSTSVALDFLRRRLLDLGADGA